MCVCVCVCVCASRVIASQHRLTHGKNRINVCVTTWDTGSVKISSVTCTTHARTCVSIWTHRYWVQRTIRCHSSTNHTVFSWSWRELEPSILTPGVVPSICGFGNHPFLCCCPFWSRRPQLLVVTFGLIRLRYATGRGIGCMCVHCIVTVERGQNEVKRKIKCLFVRGSNPPHNLLYMRVTGGYY